MGCLTREFRPKQTTIKVHTQWIRCRNAFLAHPFRTVAWLE